MPRRLSRIYFFSVGQGTGGSLYPGGVGGAASGTPLLSGIPEGYGGVDKGLGGGCGVGGFFVSGIISLLRDIEVSNR